MYFALKTIRYIPWFDEHFWQHLCQDAKIKFAARNEPLACDTLVFIFALHIQVYCSRTCKSQEDALRSAEADALGKLEGISLARDVDLDLLRMMLRLVVTRATALGLRPDSSQAVDAGGVQENKQHEEVGALGQVRTEPLVNRRADAAAAAAHQQE